MKLEPSPINERWEEMRRLGEVAQLMQDTGVTLAATPKKGLIEITGELPDWAVVVLSLHYQNLAYWWTHSPCVILSCDACGQWKLSGKRSADGGRCFNGSSYKWNKNTIKWGCQGTFRVVELPWSGSRPKRKRVKLTTGAAA